jgi:hypothetical protein
MNVDEALRQFAEGDELPGAAMKWALEHWEAASPRFISKLRAFALGENLSEAAGYETFCIVHLCGEKGETRAYEPLCRMIAEDPDIEEWLGDGTTETLPGTLINVFDGDIDPLLRAIESTYGDEYARASALEALGYLVRAKRVLSDQDMRDYLSRLRRDAVPRDESIFWASWAATAANLGYEDLRSEVAILKKDGFIEERDFNLEDFDESLEVTRNDPAGLAGFRRDSVYPLDGAIGSLESWSRGGEGKFDEGEFDV